MTPSPLPSSRVVAGDDTTGRFSPRAIETAPFPRLSEALLDELRSVEGLTATASDVLDELGYRLSVPASTLVPRLKARVPAVGHALTLRYLPTRRDPSYARIHDEDSRLAHHAVFALAEPGDVVVIEANGAGSVSTLGGIAAHAAQSRHVGACIVDGGVRDVDEIAALGFPVWSRIVTPITGKWRLEAAAVNTAVCCGGVQVRPGDLALADETGICFIPGEAAESAAERILDVHRSERAVLTRSSGEPKRSESDGPRHRPI